ncbi:putative bifunctional diguanylate cyclase/phosphodiesterase [Kineobactrum sediminis]|nr:DUF1631 family protein [Kineobactrum sediminis]
MSRNGSSNRPPTTVELLAERPGLSGGATGWRMPQQLQSSAASAPAKDAQAVFDALDALPDSAATLHGIRQAGSTADYLLNHCRQDAGGIHSLSQESRSQLAMVDNVFATLHAQSTMSPTLKPVVATLQLPLARLALLEPCFFLNQEHPARRFIDKLALLASSAHANAPPMAADIARIVDNLCRSYGRDNSVFESALVSVEQLLRQQASIHTRNLEQVLRTRQNEEQLQRAGSDTKVTAGAVDEDAIVIREAPVALRDRINRTRRLRRWVRRVEELQTGSWLTWQDSGDQRKRMQLAWISDDGNRYLFVDEHGRKAVELNRVQLARQLSHGAQPPAPMDTLSVVDQSLYDTLEQVQRGLSFTRNHDTLTRLINRDAFLEQVEKTLQHARHHGSQHAVLVLDIDKFSLVNKVYDRISGDEVLLEFSRLLAQLHSKKISSARLAADEFAVLLVDREIHQAEQIANRIRTDIAASSVNIGGENVTFTVSIGVASIFDFSPGVDDIMANARSAMLEAKQLGRDRIVAWQQSGAEVKQHKKQRQRSRRALEETLESKHFTLRAQPIIKTAIGGGLSTTGHYELLLAMKDGNGNLRSPQKFISTAERHGSMTLVDRWVIKEAFRWVSSLMDAQKVVPRLAINLSGSSVTDDAFLDYLFEQISEFGVGTNRLCFEITEAGTISNLVKAADFVRAFRNIGCKFSIDDFGKGVASHQCLRELPVDYVKIDGSFITNIHHNRNDYAMARSINDLAHFLGQETIAESVESEAIVLQLREIGVDYLQGWGVGHPRPLADVTLELASLET